jgi:murein DD-endopeptidase MepM/ murein hydrolase activator NlpD
VSAFGVDYKQDQKVTSGWLPGITGVMTQGFGVFEGILGINAPHTGIDVSAPTGSPLAMPAGYSGRVVAAGWDSGGFGNRVVVMLQDGSQVLLGHMQDVAVSPGQLVNPGDLLGHVDSTGLSTGSHVHFQVDVGGKHVDPWQWLTGAASATGSAAVGASPLAPVGQFFDAVNRLSKPNNWWRLLFVVVGGVMVMVGMQTYFFKENVKVVEAVAGGV